MIAIVVARLSLVFAIAFKNYKRATTIAVTKVGSVNVITIWEAIQKRSHINQSTKPIQKFKQRG